MEVTTEQIDQLYPFIVNPSISHQIAYIKNDIKRIKKIQNPPFQLAKYVLDIDLENYFLITNPSPDISAYYLTIKEQRDKLSANSMGQLLCTMEANTHMVILDSHRAVSDQIQEMIADLALKRVTIACGYCFKSGLVLLKETLNRLCTENTPVQLIVGSLQDYYTGKAGQLTGMDKGTVREINKLLQFPNFKLAICENRFYHGKIYFFEGDNKVVICLGSSNVSRAAYISNYELNIAFITETTSKMAEQFALWIKQLIFYSSQITQLDESLFCDNEVNFESGCVLRYVSKEQIYHQIEELSDMEVQYRLNLWLSYEPDIAITD